MSVDKEVHGYKRQAARHILLHRLRRYRDTIDPQTYHSCHRGCIQPDCLITSAIRYLEGEPYAEVEVREPGL